MAEGVPFGVYRLVRRLGAGGMAEVFLAKRLGPQGFEKQLVLKRLLPHLSSTDHFTSLFLKEARYAALIDHPNLVHVSDFGRVEGRYYLAMEYVDGMTVYELLQLAGAFSPGVAARIGADLLGALAAIHQARGEDGEPLELVHRDVSPRNLMLTRDGTVKLLDFGIAVSSRDVSHAAMGTRRHMSPEQTRGEPLDARSDLFCAGVLLYEMLTGEPPFSEELTEAVSRPASIPAELWESVAPMLALDRAERPASAREVQSRLELFLTSRGLEGTRAHLADVISGLMPGRRSVAARALEKLTDFTRTLALRNPTAAPAPASKPGPVRPGARLVVGLLGVGLLLGAVVGFALTVGGAPAPAATLDGGALASAPDAAAPLAGAFEPPPPPPPPIEPEPPPAKELITARPAHDRPPRPGSLTIDTTPWTEVYVGGKKLGLTPLSDISLPSGKHELELRNPELNLVRRIQVTIRPGKVTRVQRAL